MNECGFDHSVETTFLYVMINMKLMFFLQQVLKNDRFSHRMYATLIILLIPFIAFAQKQQIRGVITDAATNEPLYGVSVHVKGTTVGVSSNANGSFTISAAENDVIRFTYVGYITYDYKVPTQAEASLKIVMQEDASQISEVVVEAGIITREKVGFTGSFSTVSHEELKSVGNVNVLQSLKTLDPAFVVVENNLAGSNPNMLAEIELRGPTTMNINSMKDEVAISSNLPLFILDGFETTLQVVNDLDINRIESITLLKDAGSTAIYGSKGANGVVVIETIKPKPGQVFINYNGNYTLAVPILNVYNLMNAAEKLEFELLSGRYNSNGASNINIPEGGEHQRRYYQKLAMIQSGVDSYWLSEPVRNAFSQAHSLTLSGGKEVQYIAGVNYRSNPGVMKGSQRDTYGGNLRLVYRGNQGLSIANDISVMSTLGQDGSWGSFKDFADANPYYAKRNSDGSIPKYLDPYDVAGAQGAAVNPLYNASLRSFADNKIFVVTNNTSIDWKVNTHLMLRGSLSLTRNLSNKITFVDPAHSRFDGKTYDEKGSDTRNHNATNSYNTNVSANYSKSFAQHNFTLIGRLQLQQSKSENETTVAIGFPIGAAGGDPSQAFSYQKDSRPGYSETTRRSLGFITAFNYNFAYRYLFDVNYNTEGASSFGRNKRFQSFWSVGAGWNVDREEFAKEWTWMKELKLRATYGMNGNENVNVVTQSVYQFYSGANIFGQPSFLSQVGNPDLRWQVVTKKAMGVDMKILRDGRLSVTFDVYAHLTDPLVVQLEQKPSTGVSAFPLNLGYLKSKGYEFRVAYALIKRDAERFFVNIRTTGSNTKSVYGGFADALKGLNEEYKSMADANSSLQSLQKYEDGNSPSSLWAVRSLGIDPATGQELFLTKKGEQTYYYDAEDRVVIANSRPDIQGIVGLNVRRKNLTLDVSFRYYVGGHQYNTALFNKVENITRNNIVYNQDKRALYDRWRQPGDIAQFRSIGITNVPSTPTSSRFIQKESYFRGESINLRWSFAGERWLESFRLKDLTVGISTSDIFTVSTIKIERGIDYPFQRSVQMNVSMRF